MRLPRLLPALSFALLAALAAAHPARAAWSHDPTLGNLVYAGYPPVTFSTSTCMIPDSQGGFLIGWMTTVGPNTISLVQRVGPQGTPLWTSEGVQMGSLTADSYDPTLVSDGSGGAYVFWTDVRNIVTTNMDIYGQHLNANGTPTWAAGGVVVSHAAGSQTIPFAIADNAGGAIVVWTDARSGNNDVYGARLNASGTNLWTSDGTALLTGANNQRPVAVAADGAGGVLVAAYETSTFTDLKVLRVTSTGLVTVNTAAAGTTSNKSSAVLCSDGSGGAYVAWADDRTVATTSFDIYGQHVTVGSPQSWGSAGLALVTGTGLDSPSQIMADATGLPVMLYQRATGIFVNRWYYNGAGGGWPSGGVQVSFVTSANNASLAPDGSGGSVVAWAEPSPPNWGVRATRLTSTGALAWTSTPVYVTSPPAYAPYVRMVPDGVGGMFCAWPDGRPNNGYLSNMYAAHVERFGMLGGPEPKIAGVKDVPGDQGGLVRLSWYGAYDDQPAANPRIGGYSVYRQVPAAAAQRALRAGARLLEDGQAPDPAAAVQQLRAVPANGQVFFWEYVTYQQAHGVDAYSAAVATLEDSTSKSSGRTAFMVSAYDNFAYLYTNSAPDSGYSVDNLAPVIPAPFAAQYAAGATKLHWNPNQEADLQGYRLYRGPTPGFAADAAHLVAELPDTGYVDAAGTPLYYELTAVDVHGNESPVASLLPQGALGVGDHAPAFALAAPSPNPAHARTLVAFSLPAAGRVRLVLFDAAGRSVRTLADGAREAGTYTLPVTLAQDDGAALAAGLYFVRLDAGATHLVRRLAVLP